MVTGTIKANIPTRITFQMTSGTDPRDFGQAGGGKTDGQRRPPAFAAGFRPGGTGQGDYISDDEVEALVAHCASQAGQDSMKVFKSSSFKDCLQFDIEFQ